MKQEDIAEATTARTMEDEMKTTAELVVESVSMPTIVMAEPSAPNNINGTQHPTTPEEFKDDVMNRLGRANGNVFWRKPGVEGVHDGQIMVRLKKKRFIVIDYGIDPDKNVSLSSITSSRHVMIPPGAGREKCASSDCSKVGIPVLLYDSSPEEPLSLYLRSGLCFTCQRQLNEKRRTQRKRKSDDHPAASAAGALLSSTTSGNYRKDISPGGGIVMPNMMYGCKRYRTTNDPNTIMTLSPNAIIIEPALLGNNADPNRSVQEIVTDVQTEIKASLTNHIDLLLNSLSNANSTIPTAQAQTTNTSTTVHDAAIEAAAKIALSATLAPNDEATTAAAIAAASASTTMEEASAAAVAIAANTSIAMDTINNSAPPTTVNNQENVYETLLHYENVMSSIKKCVYLLTQFNASFVGNTSNAATASSSVPSTAVLLAATDGKETNSNGVPVKVEDDFTSANIAGADIHGMNVADV